MATTSWPTRRLAEEPRVIGVRSETPSARTTAISLLGSVPTTVNWAVRPSENVTVVSGPPFAAATTWLLVRIRPSEDRMIPEPSSDARPISVSSFTTLGTTLAATCSTDPAGRLAAGTLGAAVIDVPPPVELSVLRDQCDPTADAGRNDGDGQCPGGQSSCARTLRRRSGRQRRWRLLGRAAVRVIGLPIALLLRRVSPVVGLLLVAAVPVLTGIHRRVLIAGPTARMGRRR